MKHLMEPDYSLDVELELVVDDEPSDPLLRESVR